MGRGRTSMRDQYDTYGVQQYYTIHGSQYTNPHDADLKRVLNQILAFLLPKVETNVKEQKNSFSGNEDSMEKENQGSQLHEECERLEPQGQLCHHISSQRQVLQEDEQMSQQHHSNDSAADNIPKTSQTLRVFDIACGSGEVHLAIQSWLESKYWKMSSPSSTGQSQPIISSAPLTKGNISNCFFQQVCFMATDPYTQEAYTQRTGGWPCLPLSFEDLSAQDAVETVLKSKILQACHRNYSQIRNADGDCNHNSHLLQKERQHMEQQPIHITFCSFALHLCDTSYLYDLLHNLAHISYYFVILSPHKKPILGDHLLGGHWRIIAEGVLERIHYRIYHSMMINKN